jgi:hypothetical protein
MDREDTRSRTSIESKQREKYDTNQINQNIGGRLGLRGIAVRGVCADDNNHNDHRPRNGYDHNPADHYQRCGQYRHLHAGLGLLHVPNGVSSGARAVLLHEGYHCSRSSRSCRKLVGDPSRHAGHGLLFNIGRPGCGAESSIGATCPATSCD